MVLHWNYYLGRISYLLSLCKLLWAHFQSLRTNSHHNIEQVTVRFSFSPIVYLELFLLNLFLKWKKKFKSDRTIYYNLMDSDMSRVYKFISLKSKWLHNYYSKAAMFHRKLCIFILTRWIFCLNSLSLGPEINNQHIYLRLYKNWKKCPLLRNNPF